MERCTFGIITHPPTDYYFRDCQRILLSDEVDCDLSNNLFENYSMYEEYRKSSNFHCCINIVKIRIPSAPPTIQCIYDSGVHKFDIEMENVSIGIAQELMVDILIRNVRVVITRSGYSIYTYKQYCGISADTLARKWVIRIDKVKRTLQCTAQDNVI